MDTGRGEERVRWGDEGEGARNMETYITICKIDSQQEFSVWLRKVKQELWSQDGRGIGWGDHFLSYKFIKRITKRTANFTKQLLITS